jgi:hypothetical protein
MEQPSAPPAPMTAGQRYTVSVTMKNTGTKAWTTGGGYKLGSGNPQDNLTWGFKRVALPSSVAPGAEVTFSFTVTADDTAETIAALWRVKDHQRSERCRRDRKPGSAGDVLMLPSSVGIA